MHSQHSLKHKALAVILTVSLLFQSALPALAGVIQPQPVNLAQPEHKPASQTTNQVTITDSGFSPSVVTIDVGGSVTWLNEATQAQQVREGEDNVAPATPTSTSTSSTNTPTATNTPSPSVNTATATNTSPPSTHTPTATSTRSAPAELQLNPTSLSFTPENTVQSLIIQSSGEQLDWVVTSQPNWISVSQNSGSTPAVLSLTANPDGLAPGTNTGQLTLTSNGVPYTVNLSLIIGGSCYTRHGHKFNQIR